MLNTKITDMALLEITHPVFSIPEIYYVLAVFGSMAWLYIDLRVRLAKIEVEKKDHHERIIKIEADSKYEIDAHVLERNIMSKEFAEGQRRIYEKLDTVISTVTDIRIKCASHFPEGKNEINIQR
jgi:hypothetical protein